METIFEKQITFLDPNAGFDEPSKTFVPGIVTKTATFKVLNRIDRTQHKLHFMIMAIFGIGSDADEEAGKISLDSDKMLDVTNKFIKTLLVVNEDFTEQDKTLFLNDSGALLPFGLEILGEYITPFFSTLMKK